MTEEQRRQAAAQRCADLANEFSSAAWEPEDFTEGVGVQAPLFNTILELDELARNVIAVGTSGEVYNLARKHILPEPKLSPVERLAESYGVLPCDVVERLKHLGLELVERKS